jgi:glucose-6-phosphate isomerase
MHISKRQNHQPKLLTIHPSGTIKGKTGSYQKFIGDMGGVYLDDGAWSKSLATEGVEHVVYSVDEQRYDNGPGSIVVGTSTVLPGAYGDEFAVTRGHLHAVSDRAELYYCLSGRGVMLLDTIDGETSAIELTAGQAVNVPGEWIHRSVNVGLDPFVTLFSYAADAGQNYDIISEAGGMKTLVVNDGHGGWKTVSNPRHIGYQRTDAS